MKEQCDGIKVWKNSKTFSKLFGFIMIGFALFGFAFIDS